MEKGKSIKQMQQCVSGTKEIRNLSKKSLIQRSVH